MKRFSRWINRMYHNEARRWALGAAAAIALYLLAVLLQPVITYYDNDDFNIAWALAGYRSGVPSFSHPFLNPITSAVVSGLYTLLPALPWWYVVQTACMLLSIAVMNACLLKTGARSGLPLVVPALAMVLAGSAVCYYAISQVMFTLTSALLGVAAMALVLCVAETDPAPTQRFYWWASVALVGASLLIRQSSGLCVACFYFGAVLIRFGEAHVSRRRGNNGEKQPKICAMQNAAAPEERSVTKHPGKRPHLMEGRFLRQGIVAAVCALVVIAALVGLNAWGRANQNPDGFIEFENARATYMDYPHDLYYENPALYDALGWDETLCGLVNAWFYMDDRINAETLTAASEGALANNISPAERANRSMGEIAGFLAKYPIAVYLLVIVGCVFAALLITAFFRRAPWTMPLGGVCMLLGSAALMGFLLWQGRINLRTYMTVAFPVIVALLLLGMGAFGSARLNSERSCEVDANPAGEGKTPTKERQRLKTVALGLCCGMLGLISLFCGYKIFRTTVSYDSRSALADAHAVVDYALSQPKNIYIRDVYAGNNYDALTVYKEQKPTNLIDWGGCDMYTKARLAQWRVNGYEQSPNAGVFLADNVYYICDSNDQYLPLLNAYMTDVWGASGYTITEELQNGLVVVKFLP